MWAEVEWSLLEQFADKARIAPTEKTVERIFFITIYEMKSESIQALEPCYVIRIREPGS